MTALLDTLLACETRVWDALVAGDAEADASLLSTDFLGVYPDGFADRDAHIGQVSNGPTGARYRLSGAQVKPLGAEHVVLAYRAAYTRMGQDDSEAMFVSSIWRRESAGWVNVFSQDTPVTGIAVP